MNDLGPINDPRSFLGYQIANTPRRGGSGPSGGGGGCGFLSGCLMLAIGIALVLAVVAFWR